MATAVSCSVVAPSFLRQRCCFSTSCNGVCSSSVRLPTQHLYDGERIKARHQCCAVTKTQRAPTETEIFVSSADEKRCAEEGIRCYRSADGEVTCEGFDEGPHFHPAAREQQRTVMRNAKCISLLTKAGSDVSSARANSEPSLSSVVQVESRGECYCEGKDES